MPYYNKATTPLQRLKEQLQAVDVIFEVRDARLPQTSMHPKTKEFFGQKPRVIVLCKEDLADPQQLRHWVKELRSEHERAIALCLKINKGKNELLALATELCQDKLDARKRKGLLPRPVRVAVVGLPNVGKSSLINWVIGKKKAAVANTPGVTRSNSWIRVSPQIELLDTPGMLPLVAFKGSAALKLSLCNILPGDHYDVEEISRYGLTLVSELYPTHLATYRRRSTAMREAAGTESAPAGVEEKAQELAGKSAELASTNTELPELAAMDTELSELTASDSELPELGNMEATIPDIATLEAVASARSCLKTGGVLDVKRAAGIFLSEFRNGKLGRMVLDRFQEEEVQEEDDQL